MNRLSAALVAILASVMLCGCAGHRRIGKPVEYVSAHGTNIIQYRAVSVGGVIGSRTTIIVAEVRAGNAPLVLGTASAPPVVQTILGPVSTAASYVWGQAARRPDRNGGRDEIIIHDDPPAPPLPGWPPGHQHKDGGNRGR